jgi:hypothetical protein
MIQNALENIVDTQHKIIDYMKEQIQNFISDISNQSDDLVHEPSLQ